MKILMIAPEPIFEPRGTPLSVVGRLKAFSDMGHRVDLLTYSMGEDVVLPGVRIFRIPKLPGIRTVKIGPSFTKIPLDTCLLVKSVVWLLRNRYDLIHTHEEAGFWGTALARIFRIPHIYDMHSSLPQQLRNFQFSDSRLLFAVFQKLERWVLTYAHRVITICPDLYEHVRMLLPCKGSMLVENVVDYGMIFGEEDRSAEITRSLQLEDRRVVLYTGTFEPYQGLDLLIEGAEKVVSKIPSIVFLMVGGHPGQVASYLKKVNERGLDDHFLFTGQVLPQMKTIAAVEPQPQPVQVRLPGMFASLGTQLLGYVEAVFLICLVIFGIAFLEPVHLSRVEQIGIQIVACQIDILP